MSSDFILIRKMKQGDDKAFDIFVHKYYKMILNYCNYHCSDKKYVEDLTQETFLHFFKNLSNYCYEGKTKNYLYTIAGNLCRDHLKKVEEISFEKIELYQDVTKSENLMDHVINTVTIEEAIKKLPNELKEVVILFYFQQLKIREIAQILKISIPLVKYRLKQSKIKLLNIIGKEETYESGKRTYGL